jgi:hypothetical protein
VWRATGGRSIQLTTRLWVIAAHSTDLQVIREAHRDLVVTLDFHAWLAAIGA